MSQGYYIGVDVGTGSARAALLDEDGNILGESTYATTTFRSDKDARIFEQSTTEIWKSITSAVKDVVKQAGLKPENIKGLGFDATCSLAVTDFDGNPMSVTPEPEGKWGQAERNIILWADHRAEKEAEEINATGSMVLNYVGKTMSLEMEIPKVLWLKRHMPEDQFPRCMFFDLPDYLTYRATGSLARSNCSLVCKCSYVPPGVDGSQLGWQPEFFEKIGLIEMVQNDFKQLGGIPGRNGMVLTAGQPVGDGLSEVAAKEMGLLPGTPVGSALIDAYAGWVGTVAAPATNAPEETNTNTKTDLISSRHRLAAIAGTSTCHCVQSPEGILVDGVWGPYKHAVFPGMWMNEGGQSSTGQLIDFIIDTHPAVERAKQMAHDEKKNLFVLLEDILRNMQKEQNLPSLAHLTKDFYIYPDFHGNRSPLADSSMCGMITGQRLDRGVSDLALRYFATLEAIALQTRHIMDEMNAKGHEINSIYMSGGQVKNPTFMQLISDACGVPVQLPFSSSASVVAGSAILGKFAADVARPYDSGAYGKHAPKQGVKITTQDEAEKYSYEYKDHLWELMIRMSKPGKFVFPTEDKRMKALLDAKYKIFREAIVVQRKWRNIVKEAIAS
ncbi:Pentulose kinase [Tilletiaria anomala UBC 951]|uniref:Pentulose kinase n=1 Tax=Tilletiaria anomala (strain ATCC 24038 / CBS 436.72 / UBC 951) TaxID=1037660 RepID=A0A066WFT9_TILAU|nr:Pentulose kinase [Tilletiaria anomala UBC 951]KDN49929.1 Pentulose kinase [Tilletiaria anomala UBC 951]